MTALIIANPHARAGYQSRGRQQEREHIIQRLQALQNGGSVEWVETRYPRHATELAQAAVGNGYSHILAAGGDGTISEVINGLMQAREQRPDLPIFGVLPWGTLNDFYRNALAADRPEAMTLPLDIGRVDLDGIQRYCGLSVSIGLASWANLTYQRYSVRLSRRLAHIPSAIGTILTYRFSGVVTIAADSASPETQRILTIEIGNGASEGGVELTPGAKIDDALFDVSLIQRIPLWRLAFLLLGMRLGIKPDHNVFQQRRFRRLSISAEQPFPVLIDGEQIPEIDSQARHLRFQVLPGALHMLTPHWLQPEGGAGH